jgi:hypothetical protein
MKKAAELKIRVKDHIPKSRCIYVAYFSSWVSPLVHASLSWFSAAAAAADNRVFWHHVVAKDKTASFSLISTGCLVMLYIHWRNFFNIQGAWYNLEKGHLTKHLPVRILQQAPLPSCGFVQQDKKGCWTHLDFSHKEEGWTREDFAYFLRKDIWLLQPLKNSSYCCFIEESKETSWLSVQLKHECSQQLSLYMHVSSPLPPTPSHPTKREQRNNKEVA